MNRNSKIYVAGHSGLVGSAILRRLKADKYQNLIFRSHADLDLTRQKSVEDFFRTEKPDYVFLSAAKVGGILANDTYPADFIYDNLIIQTNVIHAARQTGVNRLLFLGSSCIYPRECPQPMKESYLLSGPLEKTNEPYAIAKIAGIKMCQSYNRQYGTRFLAVMPTNLYGPNDNFDLETSHVLPAMIRKFHLAKLAEAGDWQSIDRDEKKYGAIPVDFRFSLLSISRSAGHAVSVPDNGSLPAPAVPLWGSGTPRREFLYVDDLAGACLFLVNTSDQVFNSLINASQTPLINIGCGHDHTIRELASLIKDVVDFHGEIIFDPAKPDGTPQKLLDTSKLAGMGWNTSLSFQQGIQKTYQWYLN